MKNLPKHIQEDYQESFHRPDGSIRILTPSEASFYRALYRLNYFKKNKDKENETNRLNRKK